MSQRPIHNLIPHLIHDAYRDGMDSGELDAATLFVDLTGFTSMTQSLMAHGKEGAETLHAIIDRVFEPTVAAVYELGGLITGFAGDAFTAIFPAGDVEAALAAALAVKEVAQGAATQTTDQGTYTLHVNQGLAVGPVEWGIIGPPQQQTYFFRGPAIDDCAQAENNSPGGDDIMLHPSIMDRLPEGIETDALENGYHRLNPAAAPVLATKSVAPPPPAELEVARHFFPPNVLTSKRRGEFRDVAILFISFQGNPDIDLLDNFVTFAIQAVRRFGGHFTEVDFGDKGGLLLAYFGAPIGYEDNIARALNCTLALQRVHTHLIWRAGVTADTVFAGLQGSALRAKYTCMGSTVNLAARLMAGADWGQILVTERVAENPSFTFEPVGSVSYKGFAEPIPTYALTGSEDAAERVFEGEMVGRGEELAQLVEATDALFAGKFAGAAIIYGDPGMGKSRLGYALQETLGDRVTWLTAQTDQILRGQLNPFVYVLRRYFDQSPNDEPDANKMRFRARLDQLLADLEAVEDTEGLRHELSESWYLLGGLIGLRWADSPYQTLDDSLRHQMTLFALRNWLLALSRLKPLVFEIEDGQWMDDESQEALETLTRRIGDTPIYIVITSRYSDDGGKPAYRFSRGTPTTVIDLDNLSEAGLRELVEDILGGPISDALHTIMLDKTGANPFFAQQMALFLRENAMIELEAGAWTTRVDRVEVPSSISAILVARIDRLSEQVREIVKVASVLGREFPVTVLVAMLRDQRVQDLVEVAEEEQIWAALSELRYIFKHALLRDAAYDMQLRVRLQSLHEAAAEAIASLHDDDIEIYYPDMAYHYERAHLPFKAATYLYRDGERARRMSAYDDARALYDHALRHLDTIRTAEAAVLRIRALNGMGYVTNWLGDLQTALAIYERGLAQATEIGDSYLEAQARAGLADTHKELGSYSTALTYCEQAIALAQQINANDVEAFAHYQMALTQQGLGQLDASLESMNRALTIYREMDHQRMLASGLRNLGVSLGLAGQLADALDHLREGTDLCDVTGARGPASIGRFHMALILLREGSDADALPLCDEAIAIGDQIGLSETQVVARLVKAQAHMQRAEWDAAEGVLSEAADLSYPKQDHLTHLLRGIVYLRTERGDASGEAFQRSLTLVEQRLAAEAESAEAQHHRALALYGIALASGDAASPDADMILQGMASQHIAPGVIMDTLRLLTLLDPAGELAQARTYLNA